MNKSTKLMFHVIPGFGTCGSVMRRYSKSWLVPLLLSSVVTGGGSFVLLVLLTDLPLAIAIAVSVVLILVGDFALAFAMQAVSPTRVTLGPGDRRRNTELPEELGIVATNFRNRAGRISIRGETWQARQAVGCSGRLEPGIAVRIVEREGLTLIVAASE